MSNQETKRVLVSKQKLGKNIALCAEHQRVSEKECDKGYWKGYRQALEDVLRGVYK